MTLRCPCRDPLSNPPPQLSYTQAIEPDALPLPDAVAWTPDLGVSPIDPEVASICQKAAHWFSTVGAQVQDACPDVHDAQELFQVRVTLLAAREGIPFKPLL